MPVTVPASDPHTVALVVRLAANSDGIPVGRGSKPDGAGWQGAPRQSVFQGYMVVHPIDGGSSDGPVSDSQADVDWPWQVTCVGATAEQAEEIADVAAVQLMTATSADLSIPGRRLAQPIQRSTRGVTMPDRTQGDVETLFMATPRFRVCTTPTS